MGTMLMEAVEGGLVSITDDSIQAKRREIYSEVFRLAEEAGPPSKG